MARAMFKPGPSTEDLAAMKAWGLTPDDYENEIVEVWPENEKAWRLFSQLQTQWWVGMGGATGLNYLVLFAKLDRMRLEAAEADELESDIRCMEFEALRAMSGRE